MDLKSPGSARFPHLRIQMGVIFLILTGLLSSCAAQAAVQPTAMITSPPPATSATPIDATPLPTQTAAPTLMEAVCTEKSGQIEQQVIPNTNLPRPLQVRVYLPPCFEARPAQPYPVLLLLHGQGSQADQWERLGIPAAADRLISSGRIAPLVIVLPQEEDTLGNPFESGYDHALVEELLPWLGKNYPVCGQRACRAIGGLSRGAAWAMYIGLNHPQVFTAIGAHSFPSFYGDETRLPILLHEIPEGMLPQIWMDTGQRDRYISQARHYHELLEKYRVPHEWHVNPGEHEEAYWSAHVETYLEWYSEQLENR